jgi:hypothetical protein
VDKVKAVELQIAVSMSCYCAIRTVDHLCKIMIAHGHRSTMEYIKLRRNKLCMLNQKHHFACTGPIVPVGRIVMTWIWRFSCDVSTKNVLKYVWIIFGFFLVLFGCTYKFRSGNADHTYRG